MFKPVLGPNAYGDVSLPQSKQTSYKELREMCPDLMLESYSFGT